MGLVASSGQGYEITDNVPSYIRRNVGLKVGDRILRLNGQPLGNVQLDKIFTTSTANRSRSYRTATWQPSLNYRAKLLT